MPFHNETRNAFESENVLRTYQIMIRALLKGDPVVFNHTARARQHLFNIELLLQVVALEAYVHGISRQYNLVLPDKMPNPDKNAKRTTVNASLEFKANAFLKKAKVPFRRIKQDAAIRNEILKNIDLAFKKVSFAIQLRNKIGHGETFFALKKNKNKKKFRMTSLLQNISDKEVGEFNTAFAAYKSFVDINLGELNTKSPESCFSALIAIYGSYNRNDWLKTIGMKKIGGVVLDQKLADLIEEDLKSNPPKPMSDEEKKAMLDRISRNDYPKKNFTK